VTMVLPKPPMRPTEVWINPPGTLARSPESSTQATRTCPYEGLGVVWRRPSRGEGGADASAREASEG
jgi:hypothetical protein